MERETEIDRAGGRIEIARLGPGDERRVIAAGYLFDHQPRAEATRKFLSEAGHHLLIAYREGEPVGFVSGVETTHPDKGTEMFLYELAVGEGARRSGVGSALVTALAELSRARGCSGMWVLTDDENPAGLATYARAGGVRERPDAVLFNWDFSAEKKK